MIYITGDCHSDFHRFSSDIFYEQKEMTKDDVVIIAGDFGGVWYNEENERTKIHLKSENYWLDWLNNKPFTTVFVCGNHENFDKLYSYPIKEWHGGKVHEIRPNVLHLMRGEIFEIEDLKFFAFGGASSHDIKDGIIEMDEDGKWIEKARKMDREYKMFRINKLSWWEQELPTTEEMQNGIYNLEKAGNRVDYIISHSPSASVIALLGHGLYKQDKLTEYLENVRATTEYKKMFSGHMHVDRQINEKDILLFEQIIRIN